jgi:hypothetical protein
MAESVYHIHLKVDWDLFLTARRVEALLNIRGIRIYKKSICTSINKPRFECDIYMNFNFCSLKTGSNILRGSMTELVN